MAHTKTGSIHSFASALALLLGLTFLIAGTSSGEPAKTGSDAGENAASNAATTGASDLSQAQAHAQPEIEQRRQQAEQQAQGTVDQDAVAAIHETQNAMKAIANGKTTEALAAIERATGKINILVGRKPAAALLPVRVDVEAIDLAPIDVQAIAAVGDAAQTAVGDKDYPAARALLESLTSEIRVRTFNLPLATYPAAMRQAARLLDQQKTAEANAILALALDTLVVVDHVEPIPLVVAEAAIDAANIERDKDKDAAQNLITTAKLEIERARRLGYAGNDPEYVALNDAIAELQKQVEGNQATASAFSRLKDKVASFFKRQSDTEKKAQIASR